MPLNNLAALLYTELRGSMATQTYVLLEDLLLTQNATIDIQNIPQTHKDIIIKWQAPAHDAGFGAEILSFSGSKFVEAKVIGTGSVQARADSSANPRLAIERPTTSYAVGGVFHLNNYSNSNTRGSHLMLAGALSNSNTAGHEVSWILGNVVSSTVSRLQLSGSFPIWGAGTRITIWGVG